MNESKKLDNVAETVSQEQQKLYERISVPNMFNENMYYGYQSKHSNLRMSGYIFQQHKNVDILNLGKTHALFKLALDALRKCVARRGRVLFVGTEPHSQDIVKEAAKKCAQYFVSKRWLGGFLTNWSTVFRSIQTMKNIKSEIESVEKGITKLTKKEKLSLNKKYDKFYSFFEGIYNIGERPNMLVITSYKELTAIRESIKISIPAVVLLDTNADPEEIKYPVPGNDASIMSTELFCDACAEACLLGLQDEAKNREISKKRAEERGERGEKAQNTKPQTPKPNFKRNTERKAGGFEERNFSSRSTNFTNRSRPQNTLQKNVEQNKLNESEITSKAGKSTLRRSETKNVEIKHEEKKDTFKNKNINEEMKSKDTNQNKSINKEAKSKETK